MGPMAAVLAGIKDLMFRSRVEEVAKHLGTEITFAKDSNDVLLRALASSPTLILLDLDDARFSPVETISALRREDKTKETTIIGYLSHVNVDVAARAREAGCSETLPRSEFTARLPEILKPPE